MEWINVWAQQIIIAVIIATIIEMIVPKGNNKKYVKTVIGVYILFTILSPILTNAFSSDFDIKVSDYEKYFQESETYKTLSENFEESKNKSIEDAYITGIKQDVKQKLKIKGYQVNNITVKAELTDEERYGEIKSMEIEARKNDENSNEKKENNKTISINKIKIENNQTTKESTGKELNDSEKLELMKYLSEEYGVNINNVYVF